MEDEIVDEMNWIFVNEGLFYATHRHGLRYGLRCAGRAVLNLIVDAAYCKVRRI